MYSSEDLGLLREVSTVKACFQVVEQIYESKDSSWRGNFKLNIQAQCLYKGLCPKLSAITYVQRCGTNKIIQKLTIAYPNNQNSKIQNRR